MPIPSKLGTAVAEIYLAEEMRRTGKKSPPNEESRNAAPPAAQWQPAKLADYEGVYVSDEAEARCVLVSEAGSL